MTPADPGSPASWRTSFAQAGINVVGIGLSGAVWAHLPRARLLPLQLAALGVSVTLGAWVLLRRTRWTPRDARVAFFAGIAVLFPMLWVAEDENAGMGRPWAAFEAHRLSLLTVALIAPAELATGILGIVAFAALAVAQMASWSAASRTLAVGPEPWPTTIYAVFALLLLDHRVRQLRAERREAAAREDAALVERFARLSLAIGDRVGTSLQALHLDAEMVRRRAPALTDVADRMGTALARLARLLELLERQARTVNWSREAESFDADRELERFPAPPGPPSSGPASPDALR